jgi:Fur family ferric uptake transcriptional regulator
MKNPVSLHAGEKSKSVLRPQADDVLFKQIIRDMGMKVTAPRLLILESLYHGRKHVTAQELFEVIHSKDKSVGFATVYRFLHDLTKHNLATEVKLGNMPARYEISSRNHHDHLTCTQCGKICEFENLEIENLQIRVAKQFGFQLTNHVLELYGICRDCLIK